MDFTDDQVLTIIAEGAGLPSKAPPGETGARDPSCPVDGRALPTPDCPPPGGVEAPPEPEPAEAPGPPETTPETTPDTLTAVSRDHLQRFSHDRSVVPEALLKRLIEIGSQIRSRFADGYPLKHITITPTRNGGARFVWLGPKADSPKVLREMTSNGTLREGETPRHLVSRLCALMWTICHLTGAESFHVQLRDRPKEKSEAQARTLAAMREVFA